MRKKKALFTEPADIFLDTFIEVGALPPTGVVTEYTSYNPEYVPGGISTYLPHEDKGECKPYFWCPDDRPDIAEKMDVMEGHDVVPFISFEPTAAQIKRAAILKDQKEREEAAARLAASQKRKPFTKKHY